LIETASVTVAVIGIGSNHNPSANIAQALKLLQQRFPGLKLSTTYRNPAVGFEGEDFLNLAALVETNDSLEDIVRGLLQIELTVGKDFAQPRFAPQIIDLDLLLFGDVVVRTHRLELPGPELLSAPYCIRPLAELAPQMAHPVTGETFEAIWSRHGGGDELEQVDWRGQAGGVDLGAGTELRIDDLRLPIHLGVGAEERATSQEVAFSVSISFASKPPACEDDEIGGTVDYVQVCDLLAAICASQEFKTIEYLAQVAFDRISRLLAGWGCAVNVEVHKCRPPISGLHGGTRFTVRGES
jgi:2-amino-4-hydroxy-6-hydroxymethyldihydropteridine diphosphokinase